MPGAMKRYRSGQMAISSYFPSRSYTRSKYGRMMRKLGIPRGIMARVHTFRRVGNPINIRGTGGALPVINGTPLTAENLRVGSFQGSSQLAGGGTVEWAFSQSFGIANVVNASEITSLFDQYRIKAVYLKIMYVYDNAAAYGTSGVANSNVQPGLPIIHTCIDNDDDAVPANLSAVLENSTVSSTRLGPIIINRKLSPRANSSVAINSGGGVASAASLPANTWLDCSASGTGSTPDVRHYGFKGYVQNWPAIDGTAYTASIQILPTYIIEARNSA